MNFRLEAARSLQFDRVFGADASQQAVYADCAGPLVDALFEGRHGCMFAFGQTGAGKTYSMLGAEGGQRRACHDGVLPLATQAVFRRVAQLEAEGSAQYQLRCSFVEVWRERVYDLLAGGGAGGAGGARCALKLRELADGSVAAVGAREHAVCSVAQLLALVGAGAAQRATAGTAVHAHSSRSHALLTLTLERRWRPEGATDPRTVRTQSGRLSLVDLAGSEGMARAHGGAGDSDGIATNLGLHVLGRVVTALAAANRAAGRAAGAAAASHGPLSH